MRRVLRGRAVYLVLAALALSNSGCLALAAGAAAAAVGGAGYVYLQGNVYEDYNARLDDVQQATQVALADLKMPVVHSGREADHAAVESRTADGQSVQISLTKLPGRIPADPAGTHVVVRAGAFGDKAVSGRVLDQIATHLPSGARVVPAAAPPAAAVTPEPPLAAPQQQTAPPPLANPPAAWGPASKQ
jgi:hypothetical protein